MKHTPLLLIAAVLAGTAQEGMSRDGRWWLSISMLERQDYRWGYLDCYVDSLKLKSPPYIEDREASELITARYRSGKVKITEIVPRVMESTWARRVGRSETPRRAEGGESWTEPHGFLDGLYWKGGSDRERLAFVEGEVDCFNLEPSSPVRFPLPATDYVRWLNEAYGIAPASGVPPPSHEEQKIADVLLKKAVRKQGNVAPRP